MTINPLGKNLIFLISQPRAGSTLLQRLLTGEAQLHTTAEPWLLLHPLYALRSQGHSAEYNSDLAYLALMDYLKSLPEGKEQYYYALRQMACHLYNSACQQANKEYFLDKTPRYYLIIPELLHLFPKAKFIILIRNPLAVLTSVLNTLVKEYWILLARYKLDLIEAPQLLVDGAALLEGQGTVVHYETLVSEPEKTMKDLSHFLGFEYTPQMLDYSQRPAPSGQMGDPSTIHKLSGASTQSLERWLEMGKDCQTRHFLDSYLQALGPDMLTRLGYPYHDLKNKLDAIPVQTGKLEIHWDELFDPDEKLQKRLFLIELALLEHSRLVNAAKKQLKPKRKKARS